MKEERRGPPGVARMLFWPWALLLTGLRLVLALDFTDPATGFCRGGGMLSQWFGWLYAGALLSLAAAALADKRVPQSRARPGVQPWAPTAVLLGLACLLRAILLDGAGLPAAASQGMVELLLAVLALGSGIFSGLAFLYQGALGLLGRGERLRGSCVFLVTILSACVYLVRDFTQNTASASNSGHVLSILAGALGILFLIAHGKYAAGLAEERDLRRLIFGGRACALTGAVLLLPWLAGLCLGRLEPTQGEALGLAWLGMLCLHALAFTAFPPVWAFEGAASDGSHESPAG